MPQPAQRERLGRRQQQVIALRLQSLTHLQNVAMPLGGQQPDPRALAFKQGVGGNRGAMHDAFGGGEQSREVQAKTDGQILQSIKHADRLVLRRGGGFGEGGDAIGIDGDEIGEGAPDIDADAVGFTGHGRHHFDDLSGAT